MKALKRSRAERQKSWRILHGLIRAEKSEVTITLRASDRRYYYEEGVKNE